MQEETGEVIRSHALSRKDREIERKRMVLEAKIGGLKEEFESIQEELNKVHIEEELRKEVVERNRIKMTKSRQDENKNNPENDIDI